MNEGCEHIFIECDCGEDSCKREFCLVCELGIEMDSQ